MSFIRDEARQLFAEGLDFLTAAFGIVYVDTTYSFSGSHNRLDDVGAGSRLFTVTPLTGKDATDGVMTAANPANQTPASGKTFRGAWFFHDTGVESTSELLVWYSTAGGAPIEGDPILNPTTGDPIVLTLPGPPYGLLRL